MHGWLKAAVEFCSANKVRSRQGVLLQDGEVMKLLRVKDRAEICKGIGSGKTSCMCVYENIGCKSLAELLKKYSSKRDREDIK